MELSGDCALANFETTISPWQSPQAWLAANKAWILQVALPEATSLRPSDHNLVCRTKIYQRFIIYAMTHLEICNNDARLPKALKVLLEVWATWDVITSLCNFRRIGEQIWAILRRGEKSLLHPCDATEYLRQLIFLDAIAVCARIAIIIKDPRQRRDFFSKRGNDAQSLLDLLQELLDHPELDIAFRSPFIDALLKLSGASGLYPEHFVIKGIQLVGTEPVAEGRFGEVWKGSIRGRTVAVKVLRLYVKTDLEKHQKDFSREAIIWRQLSHPNVLSFYGVYHLHENRSRLCLVSPWTDYGNIVQFLKRFPETDRPMLVMDTARGLEYLHTMKPSIIHGDLKGVNILIMPSVRACLADFGLASASVSRALPLTSRSEATSVGTLRWQAPELYHGNPNSLASDIYAFACVCYEIFSDHIPFHEISNDCAVVLQIVKDIRPKRPPSDLGEKRGLDNATWNLIESCWNSKPNNRPNASEVVEEFSMLYSCADDRPLDEWLHSVQLEHGASLDHKWTHTDYLVEAHGSRDLDSSPMSLDPSPMDVCCSPALHSSPMDLYVSPYCTVSASPLAVAQAPDGFMSSPIEWLSGD